MKIIRNNWRLTVRSLLRWDKYINRFDIYLNKKKGKRFSKTLDTLVDWDLEGQRSLQERNYNFFFIIDMS